MRRLAARLATLAIALPAIADAQTGRPPPGGGGYHPAPDSPIGKPVGESDANEALDAILTGPIV